MAMDGAVSVHLLTGPHLLGMFLAWWLFGILCMQAYLFYLNYLVETSASSASARQRVRWFVFVLVIFEWVQTVLMTVDGFHWFVYNWGDRDALNDISLIWLNVPLMSSMISCSVQMFFAWQIKTLSNSYCIPSFIAVIALAHAGTGIASGIKVRVLESLDQLGTTSSLVTFTHVAEAATDVIICAAMSYYLLKMRSGIKRTDNHIGRLVRIFVETGLITASVAVLDAIFFSVFPPNTVNNLTSLVLPKLYTNSLLAVLNNRVLSPESDTDFTTSFALSITTGGVDDELRVDTQTQTRRSSLNRGEDQDQDQDCEHHVTSRTSGDSAHMPIRRSCGHVLHPDEVDGDQDLDLGEIVSKCHGP